MSWGVDQRREPRTLCEGEVRLFLAAAPAREVIAEMLDVSYSGFRAAHHDQGLEKGAEVMFSHPIFKGKARVMWTRCVYDRVESGFAVVRE